MKLLREHFYLEQDGSDVVLQYWERKKINIHSSNRITTKRPCDSGPILISYVTICPKLTPQSAIISLPTYFSVNYL